MPSSIDQAKIAAYWASRPQTYGSEHGATRFQVGSNAVETSIGSPEFFALSDEQFYAWNEPLHTSSGRFAKIFPYERYADKEVLEVGCGMGCMAMNWAQHGARVTAVDLNPVAVEQTTRRFALNGLEGRVQREDGRQLSLPNDAFDYVYSWGVLHHSPDLGASISELFRVLKPGGEFGVMLYNRRSLLYWYHILYLEGFLHGEARFLDPLELASRYTDGDREEGNPHTWPVTKPELAELVRPFSSRSEVRVLGTDINLMLRHVIAPGASKLVPAFIVNAVSRRWGWLLWVSGAKRAVGS